MTSHVIIGMGVAGVAAVEAIRASDRSAEIVIVSEDLHGFYSRPGLAYYLTGELPEKQLYIFSKKDWKQLNVRFVNDRAVRLIPQERRVELSKSGALTFDRLLLATGASAVPLDAAGGNLQGVVTLDHFENARQILKLARRGRTAVVVGGGVLALEMVEGLVSLGVQVHYFLRGDRYWPNVLDEVESRLVEEKLAHEGVHIHPRTEIAEILGNRGKVIGVRTTGGEQVRCNMVAAGIGVRPRIELAQAAGLEVERGIPVNERMQTNVPNIYAAGDVAFVYNPQTGQRVLNLLWFPARMQGRVAGTNMAGQEAVYRQELAVNVLRLGGIMTSIIGAVGSGRDDGPVNMMRGSSETWLPLPNTMTVVGGVEVNHVRLMVGERTLLGAVVMGEQTLSLPLQDLIAKQVELGPLRDQLLKPGASLGHLIMDFWYKINAG
jgi:NAD(P)H-nitrite reductase large subunit